MIVVRVRRRQLNGTALDPACPEHILEAFQGPVRIDDVVPVVDQRTLPRRRCDPKGMPRISLEELPVYSEKGLDLGALQRRWRLVPPCGRIAARNIEKVQEPKRTTPTRCQGYEQIHVSHAWRDDEPARARRPLPIVDVRVVVDAIRAIRCEVSELETLHLYRV